jgi:hypothetical protein
MTVARILLEGDTFSTIMSDGSVGERVAFSSDPAAATTILSAALGGQPKVATMTQNGCEPTYTRSDWNGALELMSNYDWLPPGQQFFLTAKAESAEGVMLEVSYWRQSAGIASIRLLPPLWSLRHPRRSTDVASRECCANMCKSILTVIGGQRRCGFGGNSGEGRERHYHPYRYAGRILVGIKLLTQLSRVH